MNHIEKAARTTMQLPISIGGRKLPVRFTRKPVTTGAKPPAKAPAVFMIPASEPAAEGGATSVQVVQRMDVEADSHATDRVSSHTAAIASWTYPATTTEAARSCMV